MDVVGGDVQASPVLVRQRLAAALEAIAANKGMEALRAALGLDEEIGAPTDLTQRRAVYAATLGKSPNTVRAWEEGAISDLALTLLGHYYAGAPTPAEFAMPHGGFLLERLQVKTVLQDRVFVQGFQTRTVVSLVDGAEHFRYGTYTPTTLSIPVGGNLQPPRSTDHGTVHEFVFDHALKRGESYTFSFCESVPKDAEDTLTIVETADGRTVHRDFSGQTFETPALRYDVEVEFHGEVPEALWSYDKLSRIERPGDADHQPRVPLDGNIARATFRQLHSGLAAGIAWTWKD